MGTRRRTTTAFSAVGLGTAILSLAVFAAGPSSASTLVGPPGLTGHLKPHANQAQLAPDEGGGGDDDGGETEEIMDRGMQYAAIRTAPAATVSSQAFTAARAAAAALPAAGGSWRELTNQPYNSDAVGYRDPVWSNSSGGSGLVSGRMSAIAVDGGYVYAGGADGGVWVSNDKGKHWTPTFDGQTSLSIGAISVNPTDHSVWVGTGEANTNFDGYSGDGIYRSADHGKTWTLVGNRLDNSLVSRITFDGNGFVLVATSQGLIRRSTLDLTNAWQTVLKPDPNPTGSPYRTSWMSDVQVRPGTQGKYVVAALGWRGGTLPDDTSYNGFYVSTTGGTAGSFHKVTPAGMTSTIGRSSLSYSANGNKLYAVVEDSVSVDLNGVYRSDSGTPNGPWTLIADNDTLANAPGSEAGDDPGGQAWYDQYVTVDPKDASHVYLGLEEVYETSNSGKSWTTIGPYWNFGKACWSVIPSQDTCPDTTHADQHAATIASDGTAYFGTDGGIYSRPTSLRNKVKWNDLNATLHTLQYYGIGVGTLPGGGDAVYGGLQDNGTSLLKPGATQMVSPMGGDGGVVLVDPNNGNRAVNEYVYNLMARTQNGGKSDGSTASYTTISPTCASFANPIYDPQPCDPNPRFIAPYVADPKNINHWVTGGQYVWDNQGKGWNTLCNNDTCDWTQVRDLGAGAQATAIGVVGKTIYAGWCGNGCNPGGAAPFISGIDTNAGGTWHTVNAPNLPNRIPTSFYVDPSNAQHVYVVYGAFSRRWIAGAGVGHVFESTNGGKTWTDRSGNLPDAPVNDIVVFKGQLVVGTDVGVFGTKASAPGSWVRIGTSLPNASTNDLAVAPSGQYLLAGTHGRGIWKFTG